MQPPAARPFGVLPVPGELLHTSKRSEVLRGSWDGAPVVLKRPRADGDRLASSVHHLQRERDVLARLCHPGIVRLLACLDDAGCPLLVLEPLEGPSLRARLRGPQALEPGAAAAVGAQIASALAYLHAERLVHADVKPSNVLLDGARAVLVDFDLARPPGGVRGRLGTRLFAAPEVARRERLLPASDVWNLGCLLYRALSGRLPFRGDGYPQLERRADAPESGAGLPSELVSLVLAMLEPEPRERPDAQEAAKLLRSAAESCR